MLRGGKCEGRGGTSAEAKLHALFHSKKAAARIQAREIMTNTDDMRCETTPPAPIALREAGGGCGSQTCDHRVGRAVEYGCSSWLQPLQVPAERAGMLKGCDGGKI
jgi:hypothetical protein